MAEMNERQAAFWEKFTQLVEAGATPAEAGRKAKEVAGYAETVSYRQVLQALPPEVLTKHYNLLLAEQGIPAIKKTINVMNDGRGVGSKTELAAAESILDRIGLAKKASVELSATAASGIIFLPPKLTEPPIEKE